jgi:hypothetical protein
VKYKATPLSSACSSADVSETSKSAASSLSDGFGKPERTHPRKLEVDREVQRDALVERLLERGRQRNVEVGRKQHFAVVDAKRRRLHRNVVGERRRRDADGTKQRDERVKEAAPWRDGRAVDAKEWRHAGGQRPDAGARECAPRKRRVAYASHQRLRSSA